VSAAFVAFGEALVDAVAVGLVGDDEDFGFGACSRSEEQAREKRGEGSHDAPMSEMTAFIDRPKSLRMINHGGGRDGFGAKKGFFATLDAAPRLAPWWIHERFPRHLLH
jgi:hypothetical protein